MHNLKETIEQGIQPLIEQEGLDLVEVKIAGLGSNTIVRVFVDKVGGVSLVQCTQISRLVSEYLDAEDLIPHRYNLEVSSPGLDRPLTTKADFQRKRGEKITLFLREKIDPENRVTGTISSVEFEDLVLDAQGEIQRIPLSLIEKALILL
jgi:ribosome maturation factor RimP